MTVSEERDCLDALEQIEAAIRKSCTPLEATEDSTAAESHPKEDEFQPDVDDFLNLIDY